MIYHVDVHAVRDGDGSAEAPFRRIGDAARIAVAGDEVVVAPGIYREWVNPRNAGTEDRRIVYRSEKPRGAVITGAEELRGWTRVRDGLWTARVHNGVFGGYNPYTTFVCGDWYFAPTVRHTGAVFLNDRMMYEAVTLDECERGEADPSAWEPEESVWKWYTEQDGDETVLYANFHGLDPNEQKVEITVRRNCFLPDRTGVDCITVSGFAIQKAATTWAPPTAFQDGMIGPHWSKGWIIEDCEIWGSKCCGISLGRYRDPENDMYFYRHHVKSSTQKEREAVCRGQYHGWLKEKIGGHVVRRCEIHHCEQAGIVGRMGAVFSTIEDCHIHHICVTQQLCGAETAGIKLHAAIDVTIRRNHVHHCVMGIWCDWQAQGTRISQNLLHHNVPPEGVRHAEGTAFHTDVFVEVSHGPTLIDNNLLLSKVSALLLAQGVACVHNLFLGSVGLIGAMEDGIVAGRREPRYTPYHIRHRTEVAGFMTILHGDLRFYNNLFIQHWPVLHPERQPSSFAYEAVGTASMDGFPDYEEWISHFMMDREPDMHALAPYHFGRLPVWVEGNAYFAGAMACAREKHRLVDRETEIRLGLTEEGGKYRLDTNVYDALGDFRVGLVDSGTLGCAFEPEQRFENPDGSDLLLDRDYFGNRRGVDALPGPFADPAELKKSLW